MFKQKSFFFLFFVLLLTSLAEEKEKNCKFKLEESVNSKYYGQQVGGVFYNKVVLFSEITATCNDNYVDLWVSRPLTDWKYNTNGGDEYDLTAGKIFSVWKNKMTVDISGTWFVLHPLSHLNGHVWSAQGRVDFPSVQLIKPYVQYVHFGPVGMKSLPAGEFFFAGLWREQKTFWKIREKPIVAKIDYRFGFSGTALGTDVGPAYNRLTIAPILPIGKNFSMVPSVTGQIPYKRKDPFQVLGDHSRIFYSVAFVWQW